MAERSPHGGRAGEWHAVHAIPHGNDARLVTLSWESGHTLLIALVVVEDHTNGWAAVMEKRALSGGDTSHFNLTPYGFSNRNPALIVRINIQSPSQRFPK